MGSVWLSLRADLRLRWRALLGLALLLGLIGGVVLTAAAGARRTDTAYPRLLQSSRAAELQIWPHRTGQKGYYDAGYYNALAGLPQVASMSTAIGFNMAIPVRHGLPDTRVVVFSSPNATLGTSADRVKILQGRPFDPRAADQVMVDQQLARRENLRPGSVLHLLGLPTDDRGAFEFGRAVPQAFRVSAIVAFDNQIVPANVVNSWPMALLSGTYSRTSAVRSFGYGDYAGVRLRPGASMTGFVTAASMLAKRFPDTGGMLSVTNLSGGFSATERAIRPQAVALAIFAVLAGLIAVAIIGQLLSRQLILDAAEFPILRALGMTRARLVVLSLARIAVLTLAGAVIAVTVAIAASPLMPIGAARLAEPSPGVEVNLAILAAGFAAIVLLPLAVVMPAAWRAAGRARTPGVTGPASLPRPSRLGPALGLAGSVTGSIGVRMAFEPGHGRTAVPVRSALVGTTVAVAAVVAALVFGTSLIGLVSTPHRYGQNWDQELDLGFGAAPAPVAAGILSSQRRVAAYAGGDYGTVRIGGRAVPAIGIDPLHGRSFLTLLQGTPPVGPHEIVLGARTLHAIGGHLGQTIPVIVQGTRRRMRIVGDAVFPFFSQGSTSATDLGNGALVSARLLSAPFRATGCVHGATCYNFFLIRYRPGTSLHAAAARLTTAVTAASHGHGQGFFTVTTGQRPADIKNYAGVRDTPLLLGAVLALLAVGTLTHVLLTGVRRRRRDLAVLKTLGLTRPQVIRVVSWQASALAAAALLVGLPLGVVAGRWSWALFAASVGVAGQADVPVPLVLLAIPAALVLANVIAAGPGWSAARIRLALILRSE